VTPPAPGTPPAPAPTPAPTPAPPATQELTPEQQEQQAKEFRQRAVANLAEQYAKELTDEDKAALLTEPEKILPQLLARATFDGIQIAQRLAQASMEQQMPAMQRRQAEIAQAETEFFTANPDLAKPEYQASVVQMAQTARALLPKGSRAEVAAKAAALARAHLGLPTPGAVVAAQPAPAAPAAPARPFSPAAPGGASPGRPAAGTKTENPWEELATPD
jgi:hypothetical protein